MAASASPAVIMPSVASLGPAIPLPTVSVPSVPVPMLYPAPMIAPAVVQQPAVNPYSNLPHMLGSMVSNFASAVAAVPYHAVAPVIAESQVFV